MSSLIEKLESVLSLLIKVSIFLNYDNLTCVSNLNYLIMTIHEFVFLKNNFILFFQTITQDKVTRRFLVLKLRTQATERKSGFQGFASSAVVSQSSVRSHNILADVVSYEHFNVCTKETQGWRDGSVVKTTVHSFRGPGI